MESLEQRRQYADQRIANLCQAVKKIDTLQSQRGLSLYLTGSYARGEPSQFSDLDLFFIRDSAYQVSHVTKADLTLIHADLHRIVLGMDFPPFSNDMQFLAPHSLEEILTYLGSPADDFYNHFTARMLLLLESRCVFNELVYENCKTEIILAYYRDYHDHRHDFIPLFLVNDIHRYWRTVCLNYEHHRNKVPTESEDKNKYHVVNLKLKFSRMLTCFSAIIPLSRRDITADPDYVRDLTKTPPLERLRKLSTEVTGASEPFQTLEAEYVWFLKSTAQPKDELRKWIGNKENRIEAFRHAREFRDAMLKLLTLATGNSDTLGLVIL
jgi:hypothetical protein